MGCALGHAAPGGCRRARQSGRAYKSERRADGARKKRCAIPLTRSKELFQPDARSDLLRFGSRAPPWSLREGRESRGGREGESKPPPSPSGPAERKTVKARQRSLFVFPFYHRPAVWASAAF